MGKFWQLYAWATILIAFLLLMLLGVWQFYPYKTLVFKDKPFPVINKVVRRGGFLQYTSNYCKYIDMSATLSRIFVNGLVYSTPMTQTNRKLGCHKVTVGVGIPHELPVGFYRLDNTYEYQVNPIRTIIIKGSTEVFEVVE